MNIVLFLPAIIALCGFVLYKASKDMKHQRLGEIMFAAGMFAICFGAAAGKFLGR